MSKPSRPVLSLKGGQKDVTTAQTAQVQAEPNSPTQEKTMEAPQEKAPEAEPEVSGPTAKQMAEAEEANALRARKLADQQNAEPVPEAPSLIEVAARGYDALQEAFRVHNENSKPKEYVPSPRTPRQMEQLQAELEAGQRAQRRAEEQKLASQPAKPDLNKEGFTTPVFRPGDVVPDPIEGGMKTFGADAP